MKDPIHNEDREVIEQQHDRFCGRIGDAAIELQNDAYRLGIQRERASSTDFRNWSVLAFRAMDDAHRALETVEGEDNTESEMLASLRTTLQDLCFQALTLHDVMTRRQLDEKHHFQRIDLEGGAA